MGVGSWLATHVLNYARAFGHRMGCNLEVEVRGDRIETKMAHPKISKKAWDSDMYDSAGLFVHGFANPVKPVVERSADPNEPDDLDVDAAGDVPLTDGGELVEQKTFDVIPSYRYLEHMNQHIISELVNPTEQWQLIVYGIIGIAALQFFTIIVTMWATGSF